MTARVCIQTQDFDAGEVLRLLRANDARIGAVCSFIGVVRDRNDGQSVSSMKYAVSTASLTTSAANRQRRLSGNNSLPTASVSKEVVAAASVGKTLF